MKILMLGWELPPHNSGGLGVACYYLCKALAQKGADIDFILPYTAEHGIDFMRINGAHPQSVEELLQAGMAYDSQSYSLGFSSATGQKKIAKTDIFGQASMYEHAVSTIVDAVEFDIIHAHDWLTFRAAVRAKEKTRAPLLLHVHSIESDRSGGGYGNPLVREIERSAMLIADRTIAVSQLTKNSIVREYAIPSDAIEVIHNSIDPTSMEPLDGDNAYRYLSLLKNNGYKVIGYVGRLTIQKGLLQLMRAAKEVVEREPKTMFLIVGSGDQEIELLETAAQFGISSNVIFTGFQRGKKWRDAFAICDLFVMPSISEPFGLVALEAIGYGSPVMISKQSGVSEILHNCLKVDFWDVNEMANQMTAVVRSDGLRDELHRASHIEYERLSWSKTADKLMDLYKRHVKAVAA